MLECFIDNDMQYLFVRCDGLIFQQTVGIPIGTNRAPLLSDLFLHSYEADFIDNLIQRKEHRLGRSFDLSFRYINNVLSLNNPSLLIYTNRSIEEKLFH